MTTCSSQGHAAALLAVQTAPATSLRSVLGDVLARDFGAIASTLYVADYRLTALRALVDRRQANRDEAGPEELGAEEHPIDGSRLGDVFSSGEAAYAPGEDGVAVALPVVARGEPVGVLAFSLPESPDGEARRRLAELAAALGHAWLVARRDTDDFERAARTERLSLAAEIQWDLLPGRGCAGPGFELGGHLEPAYQVAGDTFDWSAERDHLVLSVVDSMGWGVQAALLTSLTVGALRNARRSELSLADQAHLADEAIYGLYGGERFAEALLLRFDHKARRATAVDAGSPRLVRLRGGSIEPVGLDAQLPLGLFEGTHYLEREIDVVPGDRVAILSDGVHAARSSSDEEYGDVALSAALEATRHLRPREAVRRIVADFISFHGGRELRDDAVVVVCDWTAGGPAVARVTPSPPPS